ncbi:MAG: HAD family phosphatase [Pseudomonadota bacterium]
MKNVVFDVGNVLLDWDARRVFRLTLPDESTIDRFIEEVNFFAWNLSLDAGRSFDEGVRSLCERFPHYSQTIQNYHYKWHESVQSQIDDSVAVLENLKQLGAPCYAITNFSDEKWCETIKRFSFLNTHFIDVVVSGKEKLVKPDRKIFDLFLIRNQLEASDCIFIDDSIANIISANAIGFDTIHFNANLDLAKELRRKGLKI